MLDATTFNNAVGAYDQVLDLLGSPAVYTDTTGATKNVQVGLRTVGPKDEALINAYGANAVVVTMKARDFTTPPAKFDQVVVNGKTLTFDAVHDVMINAQVRFYKAFCKGHSS